MLACLGPWPDPASSSGVLKRQLLSGLFPGVPSRPLAGAAAAANEPGGRQENEEEGDVIVARRFPLPSVARETRAERGLGQGQRLVPQNVPASPEQSEGEENSEVLCLLRA